MVHSNIRTIILSVVFAASAVARGLAAAPPEEKKLSDKSSEKQRLVVLDLKAGEGVPQSVALIISDLIRTGMVKSRLFIVVDRNSMQAILEEQAFQKSGCTDTACAIKVGRLLAADKMLIGSVNKAGAKFIINGSIVDVGEAKIEFAEFGSIENIGKIETGAEEYSRRIAARISGVDADSLIHKKPRWPFVWRSALVPGWGQWKEDQRILGFAYFSLAGLALGNYGSNYRKLRAAQDDYNKAIGIPQALVGGNTLILNYLLLEEKKARHRELRARTSDAINILSFVWFANAFDAFLSPGSVSGFFGATGPAYSSDGLYAGATFSADRARMIVVGLRFRF